MIILIEIENSRKEPGSSEVVDAAVSTIHTKILEIQQLTESIAPIYKTVDEIKSLSTIRLDKIVSILNVYRRKLNETIELSLQEFERLELQ